MPKRALNAIVDMRQACANVAEICDQIIYAKSEAVKGAALHSLPRRVRTLRFRANRLLTALEAEGDV